LREVQAALAHVLEFKRIWPYFDGFVVGASHQLAVGKGDHRSDAPNVALEVANVLEGRHIKHVDSSIVRASNDLPFWQSQCHVYRP